MKRLLEKTRFWTILIVMACLGSVTDVRAATQEQINTAIQQGLAWQATQQDPSSGAFYYWHPLAETSTAVLAFENEGHFPGGGGAYSANVEKGLDYIFSRAVKVSISNKTAGNPDSNGNGQGIYFEYQSALYETGLVMQAIVASNTPERTVSTGTCAGMTYQQVLQDVVDFLAWSQSEGGPGRGGWWYYPHNMYAYADNSVSQWPVLGLVAAEQWGIQAPAFVKSELEHWVTYIQNANGGSGYDTPSTMVNISKTGGLLVEFYYLGDSKDSPRVVNAINYINAHWNDVISVWDGNKGHPYAMFSVFKGLELLRVPTIPNAQANADTPAGDWWGDYAHNLVTTQLHPRDGLGYWDEVTGIWGPYLATPWYIVILQASVFPVSVDVVLPGSACDLTGYEVSIKYSVERFTATGTLMIYRDKILYVTVPLTDFKGTATETINVAPETVGDHTWTAVLDVTGGGITSRAEDSAGGSVYATPVVAGIPDQVAPFKELYLDRFLSNVCSGKECPGVEWTYSGVPADWSVKFDPISHVAAVIAPAGASVAADITFTATIHWKGVDCVGSDTATFSPNRPPIADPGKDYPDEKYIVSEGGNVMLDGSLSSDPDGDTLISYAWDLDGDGTFEKTGTTVNFSAAGMDGPAEVYVHLQVCDEHGACDIGTAEVEIENVAPEVTELTVSQYVVPINTIFSVAALFTDVGTPDSHTNSCNFGDGGDPHPGVVNETPGTGTANASSSDAIHTDYATPGVYTVTMMVTDDDGATGNATATVVAYDPSAGFVSGGGWIDSPVGAYQADLTLAGRANFGFVSKYQKGATKPTGQTEFNFQIANLNFHSSSYDWLVVTNSGTSAQYKGSGTINGSGDYRFMLWADDGTPDKFRIRIWTEDSSGTETVVYDNGDDDKPQPIAGGSIVIHTAKTGK